MGIVNREGALYLATGIDNTGLYSGRREAMGIIKAMAGQITSFDVFSGIGISAATAFASAAKSSYDFEKEFQKNMLEVATISTQVTDDMTGFMNQVMAITQEIPIKAPEAAKALYQIVSAGHDGAAGMKILEVSAKSAVGGLTDTATAADAITTVLNAYKMSADEASNISDQLFTTVRLGKTTFGELGQSIAQVAPIAASYGVEIDQVLAAVASLTKQGTPTAQAMTQIRAAIIGTSKVLGDGAFEGRTFQEALAEVATRANGSESKLRELVPEIEAVNGVLGMTGKNAQAAASDLGELQSAAGATEAAFGKMKDEVGNQMILLSNNIQAALRPMGEAILKEVSEVAKSVNEAFGNGNAQKTMKALGDLIVVVAGAFVGYKGAVIASTVAQRLNIAVLRQTVLERKLERVALLNGVVGHQSITTAQLKEIATRKLLISTIKVQSAAMLKNLAAFATNPYVLAAAAISALGYGIYKYASQASVAEKAQKRFNARIEEQKRLTEELKNRTDQLLEVIRDETKIDYERNKALKTLKELYPQIFEKYDVEALKLADILQIKKQIAELDGQRSYQSDKSNYATLVGKRDKLDDEISYRSENYGSGQYKYGEFYGQTVNQLKKEREGVQHEIDLMYLSLQDWANEVWNKLTPREVKIVSLEKNIKSLKEEQEQLNKLVNGREGPVLNGDWYLFSPSPVDIARLNVLNGLIKEQSKELNSLKQKTENDSQTEQTVYQRKIQLTKELTEAKANLNNMRSPNSKAKDADITAAENKVKEIKSKLELLTGISMKEGDKLKQAEAELSRLLLDSELKLQADRIAIMKDGKDKRVLLADQEYKETLATIKKEREEYQRKVKESGGKEDSSVMSVFRERESSAKDKRSNDVANIAKEYADQLKAIQNEVDSNFRSQLDNRLIEIDSYYKEQVKIAKEAGEEEEGDFIQMLLRKQQAEREYARKGSALSSVDFKEQVDLGLLGNKSNDTYFVEEVERQKTEIVRKYALERIAILESMGDEQSKKDTELLKIAVEGYDKALSKPSKKSINKLIDEKAIKALQKRFVELGSSEEEAKEKAIEYAEGFKGKMQMVSDVTDSLKTAFGGISDELDMALDAVSNIAQGFAEGGLIGGISAAAGQLVSIVGNLFTAKKEIDKSMVEGYETYMDAINDLIDTQVALIDKLGGMAFGQNIIDTTKDIAKSIAASRTLFNEAMRAGAGMFSHSDGYKANKMLNGYAKELREVGIYTTDLSRMTNEQLASLKKLPEVYARLPEGLRKYIDAIAEGIDKTEGFKEQIQDTVLGMDFTSIADMIVSSLTDPSIDNALEEFEANIDKTIASIAQNMLRRNMLLGPLEKMTNDLYKSMEKKDKDGNTYYKLTAESAKNFKDNVLGLGKQFQDAWKELEEAFSASGIDLMPKENESSDATSDNSLKGAYAKASQESIDLLAGQTGALRIEAKSIREQIGFIYDLQSKGWEDVRVIKELTTKVEENSGQIANNTKIIYEITEKISDVTRQISEDTRRSADALDGGTITTKIKM